MGSGQTESEERGRDAERRVWMDGQIDRTIDGEMMDGCSRC